MQDTSCMRSVSIALIKLYYAGCLWPYTTAYCLLRCAQLFLYYVTLNKSPSLILMRYAYAEGLVSVTI